MSELTLVGLDEDGEHVVLEGPDGRRFRVRIDEALRAAVRRDRPQLEQARAVAAATLAPREIQARIRAGASAEQVAEESGTPVEIVRRYDGPVVAEREYVAQQARATRVGHDPGSPVLGDLVTDRLATREVRSLTWDAHRGHGGPWTVEVRFVVGDADRSARWTYDAATRRVRALDDEARWLSETELPDEPIPRRHLAAVRDRVFDIEVDDAVRPLLAEVDLPTGPPDPPPADTTHALLDDLAGRRGVRQEVSDEDEDDDERFAGFGPQHAFDFDNPDLTVEPVPAAHPPASRPDEAADARVLPLPPSRERTEPDRERPEPAHEPTGRAGEEQPASGTAVHDPHRPEPSHPEAAPRARGRRGRASVPSWDEIVFGARNES